MEGNHRYFIMTDIEGVTGVQSFENTRTNDVALKGWVMKQLALETNACIAGILEADPQAEIDVFDGHGTGGLFAEDLINGRYVREAHYVRDHIGQYRAMLFVGQHAMAGTIHAPLCHTFSSVSIQHYRINGVNIGEFAAIAGAAGVHDVPTIFLAGDDKAAMEAQMFVPNIETVVTKLGLGMELAEHIASDIVCKLIQQGAAKAVRRIDEIGPLRVFEAPFEFEARYFEPQNPKEGHWKERTERNEIELEWLDSRTYRLITADYAKLPFM